MKNLSLSDVINGLDRQALARALRVGQPMISNAIAQNAAPAVWYPTCVRLGRERGVCVPPKLFKWRNPEDAAALDREASQ